MEIVWVEVILGGNFPGENCPGANYTEWEISQVGVSRGAIVRMEIHVTHSITLFKKKQAYL